MNQTDGLQNQNPKPLSGNKGAYKTNLVLHPL
jgi:hypothetical protein